MPKKRSRTQEHLEAQVLHEHSGVIDMKKLWKKEEDKELDPNLVKTLVNANPQEA